MDLTREDRKDAQRDTEKNFSVKLRKKTLCLCGKN